MNKNALEKMLDDLAEIAWGYGYAFEDVMTDVEKLKRVIVDMVFPDGQGSDQPGEFVNVGPVEDDWIVTGIPGQPSQTVAELRASCGDD